MENIFRKSCFDINFENINISRVHKYRTLEKFCDVNKIFKSLFFSRLGAFQCNHFQSHDVFFSTSFLQYSRVVVVAFRLLKS